ncbi:hypothetical protein [Desulfocurvibacter africanus]|uniref:hypothetical protein n=1 Tax=Desulfocurvibacter africanus TaxID=873 RepID=UPI00048A2B5D|nr:hypothetical protein [Desulfocurvibacter africanus]
MFKGFKRLLATVALLLLLSLLTLLSSLAHGAILHGGEQADSLGRFVAGLHYHSFSPEEAELTITVTNLQDLGAGHITGFALNNPGGRIERIAPAPDFPDGFQVLGADAPQGAVQAERFGDYDFGAALDGDFSGAGDPELAVGTEFGSETKAFRFYLHGRDLHLIDDYFFLAETAEDSAVRPGFFAARFAGLGRDGDEAALSVADFWVFR